MSSLNSSVLYINIVGWYIGIVLVIEYPFVFLKEIDLFRLMLEWFGLHFNTDLQYSTRVENIQGVFNSVNSEPYRYILTLYMEKHASFLEHHLKVRYQNRTKIILLQLTTSLLLEQSKWTISMNECFVDSKEEVKTLFVLGFTGRRS